MGIVPDLTQRAPGREISGVGVAPLAGAEPGIAGVTDRIEKPNMFAMWSPCRATDTAEDARRPDRDHEGVEFPERPLRHRLPAGVVHGSVRGGLRG